MWQVLTRLQVLEHLPLESLEQRGAILVKVGTAQLLVQAVQIATGMWILWRTTKEEYAYYTIANMLVFTTAMLADSGVTASLSAAGGKAWQDRFRMGTLLWSGLAVRRQMLLAGLALVIPVSISLLISNGASVERAILLTTLVGFTVAGELTSQTYLVVLRLRRQYAFTQRTALWGALGRLISLTMCSLRVLRAEMAFLSFSANTFIQWLSFRRKIGHHAELDAPRDPVAEREMKRVVMRQMPLTLYFCLQGQIAIWLASTMGTAHEVSDIGALTRFGALFSVSQAVMQEVVLPAFTRAQGPELVGRRYLQIVTGYASFLAAVVLTALMFRGPALAILGQQYSQLGSELVLAIVCSAVVSLSQMLWALNYSRAWILSAGPYIAVTTSLQVALFFLIGAGSVSTILWFTLLSTLPSIAFASWHSWSRIRALKDEIWEAYPVELNHA